MSFTLTDTQAVLHCIYSSSQSFTKTDLWDFLIQQVVLNILVKTNAVHLLYSCEGMKYGKCHKSTDYYRSQCVKFIGQLHAGAKLAPVHIG